MIIDGHSHVMLPVKQHIETMNRAGVDKTILFSTTIHPEETENFSGMQREMQRLNEILQGKHNAANTAKQKSIQELKQVIITYPTHYLGFGPVPVGLPEGELKAYMEQEIIKNGFIGLGEFTLPSGAVHLLDPIARASQNFGNLPLWIHGFNPLALQDIKEIAELAKKIPSIPIILGHLGGSNWLETIPLVKEIPNLYMDISAFFSTLVLKVAIQELPDKCIFGVDMPYGDLELSLAAVRKVSKSKAVTDAVLGENIAALLKL